MKTNVSFCLFSVFYNVIIILNWVLWFLHTCQKKKIHSYVFPPFLFLMKREHPSELLSWKMGSILSSKVTRECILSDHWPNFCLMPSAQSQTMASLIDLNRSALALDALETPDGIETTESSSPGRLLLLSCFGDGALLCSQGCPWPPAWASCGLRLQALVRTFHIKGYLVKVITRHFEANKNEVHTIAR